MSGGVRCPPRSRQPAETYAIAYARQWNNLNGRRYLAKPQGGKNGNTLFIAVGEGDLYANGTVPGTRIVNAGGISSPIFDTLRHIINVHRDIMQA